MSQYSEMIGSFLRTGKYPLEADYIFTSELALKDWANDPYVQPILHEGLLKIVVTEDKQLLWWVINLNNSLEFKLLIDNLDRDNIYETLTTLSERLTNEETLEEVDRVELEALRNILLKVAGTDNNDIILYLNTLDYHSLTEISNELHQFLYTLDSSTTTINTFAELLNFLNGYSDSDNLKTILEQLYKSILGTPIPDSNFRTLRDIEEFINLLKLQSINSDQNLLSEINQTQIGVGLNSDGSYSSDLETYYLKNATSIMHSLRILDSLINLAINNCNLLKEDTSTLDLTITKLVDSTTIKGDVKVSTESGNTIIIKLDGLYCKLATEYTNGILTIKINDNIISQHNIALPSIVNDAYYNSDTEEIIIIFALENGSTQTVRIAVASLINEWIADNTLNKVVEITKERVINGSDKVSADVRISSKTDNILSKDNNSLYVKNPTASSIKLTNGNTVEQAIESQLTTVNTITDLITSIGNSITDEVNRATTSENNLLKLITQEVTRAENSEIVISERLDLHIVSSTEKFNELFNKFGIYSVTEGEELYYFDHIDFYQNYIYFCTDTKFILLNGNKYNDLTELWSAITTLQTDLLTLTNNYENTVLFVDNINTSLGFNTEGNYSSTINELNGKNVTLSIDYILTKLNTVADSDDLNLDQLSEIVSYIKNNKDLIDDLNNALDWEEYE